MEGRYTYIFTISTKTLFSSKFTKFQSIILFKLTDYKEDKSIVYFPISTAE